MTIDCVTSGCGNEAHKVLHGLPVCAACHEEYTGTHVTFRQLVRESWDDCVRYAFAMRARARRRLWLLSKEGRQAEAGRRAHEQLRKDIQPDPNFPRPLRHRTR